MGDANPGSTAPSGGVAQRGRGEAPPCHWLQPAQVEVHVSSWPRGRGVEALALSLLEKGPSSLEELTRQVGEVG